MLQRNIGAAIVLSLASVMLPAIAADEIEPKELYTAQLGERLISKVDVQELDLKPLQQVPLHKHPCAVISYIVSGSVTFKVQGQPEQTFEAGSIVSSRQPRL